jgi:ABC-type nitrate/sulfonate/bicarbonate transport system substrate-binding protein
MIAKKPAPDVIRGGRRFPAFAKPASAGQGSSAKIMRQRKSSAEDTTMTMQSTLTRRRYLAASGAGVLALGLASTRRAAALESIRQGYQTNIWGMPTYYLIKSGYLEKHGLAVEEFAVPSGNLTMQQMVARQVDLGTYAGQSFIIGNAKGGLVAIALIEYVGKTARITTRKDLNITKVEELRGRKVANQTGSSTGNVLVDSIMPQHGLKKGDYQEIRMDVNNMVAALAAKTVDAMASVEPYNVIAVTDGIGSDLMDFSSVDPMPVFMAATPDFVDKKPDTVVAYLKAWLDVARDFKDNPKKVADLIYAFYTDKGYTMSIETFATALSRVEVNPGFPGDLKPYMQQQAEILLQDKKIDAIPDWSKALRPDFMEKARTGA